MTALILGTVIALGALGYVLYPIFFGTGPAVPAMPQAPEDAPDIALVALREIEFDRATGKLSDTDYAVLRDRYTAEALVAMRRADTAAPAAGQDDAIEAAVRAYRESHATCASCGPRPEPDAIFCSGCGSYLPGRCAGCGTVVTEAGARFCAGCGRQLAA